MTSELDAVVWPAARLGEALAALARAHDLVALDAAPPAMAAGVLDGEGDAQARTIHGPTEHEPHSLGYQAGGGASSRRSEEGASSLAETDERRTDAPHIGGQATEAHESSRLEAWLDGAAAALGIEVEPVSAPHRDLGEVLRRAAPALVRLPDGGVLALAGASRDRLELIGPDDARARRPLAEVRARLAAGATEPHAAAAARVVERAGLTGRRAARAHDKLVAELVGGRHVGGITLVRARPGASFWAALRAAGVGRALAVFVVAQLAFNAAWLAGWWLLGRGALSGRLDRGWLAAWALLLFAGTLLRILALGAQGRAAIRGGAVLRARLVAGALRLDADSVRHEGVGQHLGRVLDADVLENLALGGGATAATALINLALAPMILGAGAGGGALLVVFTLFAVLAAAAGAVQLRRRREHTAAGLRLTHELVERLVGHRTRLVQEPRSRWHDGIDHLLGVHVDAGRRLDATITRMLALLPRTWLVAGLCALAPAFVGGAPLALLAISVGGLLLAQRGLRNLGDGVTQLAGAAVAWRQVRPLFVAADAQPLAGAPGLALLDPRARPPLIEARDISFRHRGRAVPVLDGLDLTIAAGDRLLLEGPSGGGKSTLAALLAALRVPARGLVLLGGLDRASLGDDGWRRHVVNAPQFHENYVFAETLLFNVLLGRGWPASARDAEEAETVCRELGLGPLLDRMPAGMQQMVGDMGWQLSHGERSRVFIARALLARAEMLILDESFAALDPETLGEVLRVVDRRAGTLLVIAHP